ncbi:hypothetical protein AVEN_202608-1 [Araneus ventricosus]|uniref:Uncharacterized protein n=1 Tax=Araneus ventricosus TaxID=182803 RepID=A0A4Y2VL30_ARAVE|nr:hypothetical protein AVEN_202608-1 [Araneus ventricosus]
MGCTLFLKTGHLGVLKLYLGQRDRSLKKKVDRPIKRGYGAPEVCLGTTGQATKRPPHTKRDIYSEVVLGTADRLTKKDCPAPKCGRRHSSCAWGPAEERTKGTARTTGRFIPQLDHGTQANKRRTAPQNGDI